MNEEKQATEELEFKTNGGLKDVGSPLALGRKLNEGICYGDACV